MRTLLLLIAIIGCTLAQDYCVGDTYTHLKSYNIDAATLTGKPLTITAQDGIITNVKFVVLQSATNVQVTVLGQGSSTKVASTVGHTLDQSNGLTITLKKQAAADDTTSAASVLSRSLSGLFLPLLVLTALFRKQTPLFLLGVVFALYSVNAADYCTGDSAGATITIAIPNGFKFSAATYTLNNGVKSCEASEGLFAPVCNQILYDPIPNAAVPAMDYTKGYVLQRMTGGIYFISDGYGLYTAMFVVTTEGVIVVDAPPNIGAGFLAAIASVTDLPVKYFVYSHHHTDHVGSANIFANSAVTYIAHQFTHDAIQTSNSPFGLGRVLPNITFTHNYTLTLGNETLFLNYYGSMHSDGDVIVYSETHKVVMFVDIVYGKWAPFRQFGETINTQGYFKAHHMLLDEYPFDYYVSGHLGIMKTQDVTDSLALLEAVRTATITALSTITPPDIGQDVNGNTNNWLTFNTYLDHAAAVCAEIIREEHPAFFVKYAGLDVFIFSHCDVMVRSMRLE